MGLTIRDVTAADRDAVLQVTVDAYTQYSGSLPADRWEPYRNAILASFDNEGPAARIVATEDDRIVGSVQLFLGSESAYGAPELGITGPIIRYLAVPPEHRGKGIATALIREAVSRSIGLGADWLHLHTSDMMASAVSLYERLGFERAVNTDVKNGETLVKGYRLDLKAKAASL
ncbi:GNAT family N-acetyltransferase [Paenibacillus rhizovicinus]|uniref:GNAT family N-acetyltransferase n=1 Tax=Paenibacillus rhizovicinus TaxID=2704463 RepID=A0A6C0P4F7_9BACL|nr:GNAT family N-acetyltransferase [Paenibacillus rhizovicinus]QHW33379.1 GNAT family N-acetyltransferase [Paenibacillus rhizovicinus]